MGDNEEQTKVTKEQVQRVVNALLRHLASLERSEEDFVSLILTLRQIPDKKRTNPYKIPLKHSLFDPEQSEICFIVKDPQRKVKQQLAERGNQGVTKVLGISKLRARYKTFEAKRALCRDFQLFLCDRRVLPMLPKLLGKPFFHSKKLPSSVDMSKDIVEEVSKARDSAQLFLGQGSCSAVRVARTTFSSEKIVENVMAALEPIVDHVPDGWDGVLSLFLKASSSAALPLYEG